MALIIVAEFAATGRVSTRLFHTFVDGNNVHGAGLLVGATVGFAVGAAVGGAVGLTVGTTVGLDVGLAVGSVVGATVGSRVGGTVGITVGPAVGPVDGLAVGPVDGADVGVVDGLGVAVGRGAFVGFGPPRAAARSALESVVAPSVPAAGPNRPTLIATATTRTPSANGDRRCIARSVRDGGADVDG
jgi:hypothetical protein